jgi:hypothetical protein
MRSPCISYDPCSPTAIRPRRHLLRLLLWLRPPPRHTIHPSATSKLDWPPVGMGQAIGARSAWRHSHGWPNKQSSWTTCIIWALSGWLDLWPVGRWLIVDAAIPWCPQCRSVLTHRTRCRRCRYGECTLIFNNCTVSEDMIGPVKWIHTICNLHGREEDNSAARDLVAWKDEPYIATRSEDAGQ